MFLMPQQGHDLTRRKIRPSISCGPLPLLVPEVAEERERTDCESPTSSGSVAMGDGRLPWGAAPLTPWSFETATQRHVIACDCVAKRKRTITM